MSPSFPGRKWRGPSPQPITTGYRLTIATLNYNNYFNFGEQRISNLDDYTSHNTTRLQVPEIKGLLLQLDYIQNELERWSKRRSQNAMTHMVTSR